MSTTEYPKDLRYTNDLEWLRPSGGRAVVGITAFAVEQLGDITMVDLPKVGAKVKKGDAFGTVESVKSVSDLYAPVSGTVVAVNAALKDAPELVNQEPYGGGWMIELEIADAGDLEPLMDATAYAAHAAG
jgi:glycine cleavage system H protein